MSSIFKTFCVNKNCKGEDFGHLYEFSLFYLTFLYYRKQELRNRKHWFSLFR
jgi:hypothetical protein